MSDPAVSGSEFLAITGLSGAGRSLAADHLEDVGWFVIDNLPPALIPKVAELAIAPGSATKRVALVVGTGPYHTEVMPSLEALRASGAPLRILFLDAATDVLVSRYSSTKRRHPLAEGDSTVQDAIERERELLAPVKAVADVVIDTSGLHTHQLRSRILALFGADTPSKGMQTTVMSFGYKYGLPLDVDLVLDCRFLPNPYWVESLRPQTGLDPAVRDWVLAQPGATEFLDRLEALLVPLMPAYVAEGKSYLSIAVGCTGGRHRSVTVAEELNRRLRRAGYDPIVHHRDVGR